MSRIVFATLSGAICATWSVAPLSADLGDSIGQLAEIVVTAEKRSENLQSVPMSIVSLGSAELQTRAVESFMDYGTTVPNLSFGAAGDGSANSRQIAIRGISGTHTTGFYIDEIPLPDSLDPRIIDMDHIEVLRGPQGTLYGASSMGGTVRVITKQPNVSDVSADLHASVSSTWNTNQPNWTGDGVLNIPIVKDYLAVRLVGFEDSEAGFFKREFPTVPGGQALTVVDNVAAIRTTGMAMSILWKPLDGLEVRPRVLYQFSSYNGFPYADVTDTDLNPTNFVQRRTFNVPEGGYDKWTLASLGITYQTPWGEIVSASGYFDRYILETENQTDFFDAIFPLIPSPTSGVEIKPLQRFVEEVRFASSLPGPVQFVTGLFYETYRGQFTLGEFPPTYVKGIGAVSGYPSDLSYAEYDPSIVRQTAAYGELTYKVTSKLKVTAGLRWYELATTSSDIQEGAVIGPTIVDPPATTRNVGVNPKGQINYQLTPSALLYATAAKGFRPGGIFPAVSPSPAFGCPQELASFGDTVQSARHYQADSLWTYELGGKTEWLNNRLTVNGAAFYTDWQNIQQLILLKCGFQFEANAGAAKSEGGELEIRARPISALDVNAGLGYNHAVITKASSGGAISPQAIGSPVYQIPDWTGSVGATYTQRFSGDYKLVLNSEYSYVGRSFSGNNDPSNPRERAAYRLLDLRMALPWERYEAAIFAKNVTNDHANLSDNRSIVVETPGRPRVVTNQPRTVGVEFRARF